MAGVRGLRAAAHPDRRRHVRARGWDATVDRVGCLGLCHAEPPVEFDLPCGTVIPALGNRPNPLLPETVTGLETSEWGTVKVDPRTMTTTRRGVFAGGDIVSGAATVIQAMGQGRLAAAAIHDCIRRRGPGAAQAGDSA